MIPSDYKILTQAILVITTTAVLHYIFSILNFIPNDLLPFLIGILVLYVIFQLSITPKWFKPLCTLIFFTYIIFFSGLSGFIRPFFDNMSDWSVTEQNKNYRFKGTGVAISTHHLLTNYHVVKGCKEVKIRYQDNSISNATIVTSLKKDFSMFGNSKGFDVTLLETEEKQKNFAIFSDKPATNKDLVIGPEYTSTPGQFNKRYGTITNTKEKGFFEFSGPGRKGNSGSPIYNNEGYLIGIQWGISGNPLQNNINTGTTINVIETMLKTNYIPYNKARNTSLSIRDSNYFKHGFAVGILCHS